MTYEIYEAVTNFTTVPNIILDVMMAEISNAELRVLLALVRKTYGWQKQADKVSLSQLQTLTGMTRKSVLAGITGLEQHGVVTCERGTNGGCNYYTVKVKKADEGSIPSILGESLGGIPSTLANPESSIRSTPTKEKALKKTKELNKKDSVPNGTSANSNPQSNDSSNGKKPEQTPEPAKKPSRFSIAVKAATATGDHVLGQYSAFFAGTSKKGEWAEWRINGGASAEEIMGYALWWEATKQNMSKPKAPDKIAAHFSEFCELPNHSAYVQKGKAKLDELTGIDSSSDTAYNLGSSNTPRKGYFGGDLVS